MASEAIIGTDIDEAIRILNKGELVAIPTETVYGLAGNGLDEKAVLKIFEAKNRPFFDPLILHTSSIEKIYSLVESFPENALKLAKEFWPGPLTLVLKKKSHIPDLVSSGLDTVAVRIPNHPLTLSLLEKLEYPLAAPSANPFGYISPTRAEHVMDQLGNKIQYILNGGPSSVGVESTIVGFNGNEVFVFRTGGIPLEKIESVIGKVNLLTNEENKPVGPGMLESHYAPRTKLITGDIEKLYQKHVNEKIGIITFKSMTSLVKKEDQIILSPSGSLEEAATNLFASMRELDKRGYKLILAESVPETGLGRAINDRLRRASSTK